MNIATEVKILPVSFVAILDAPNSGAIISAYAEECLVPGATPQRAIYSAMERAGALHCFAAYSEDTLIGFASVLTARMPHTGDLVATLESLFVEPLHRDTGAANMLLDAAEQYALDTGCSDLTYAARVGSRLDKVLSRRAGCKLTHAQYTRRLR